MSPATVHHTEAVFSNPRTRTWRPYEWFGRKNGYLGHISECHSSSSSSSWTRLWGEFAIREDSSLEQCGTAIPWNWKTDQWTRRSHWGKHNKFQRIYVDVDKLIVWKGLSVHQRHNLRLLRLCALRGKNGRWSCYGLEEQNWMVFGKQSLQRYESNRWKADGVRVENIPRNQHVRPPREDSKSDERPTVWTWALMRNMLIDSRAVIGLSWGLDQKWYETNTDKPDRSSDRMAEEMILNF